MQALRDQVAALEKARNDYVAKYKRQVGDGANMLIVFNVERLIVELLHGKS